MRVYISGPITGTDDYIERFSIVETGLKGMGFEVVNPAAVNANLPEGLSHDDYMHVSFAMLDLCDAIFMLSGWEHSDGATREAAYASAMNIRMMTMEELETIRERKCENEMRTGEDKWRLVSEATPDKEKEAVLVTVLTHEWIGDYDSDWIPDEKKVYHSESRYVTLGFVSCGQWYFLDQEAWDITEAVKKEDVTISHPCEEVIAWMPLMEPYQEEE